MGIRGVGGKPYRALDDIIDVEALQALHEQIAFGIVRSPRWYGSYGRNILEPGKYLDPAHAEQLLELPENSQIKDRFTRLRRIDDKRLFLKLAFGAYSGHRILILRSPVDGSGSSSSEGHVWTKSADNFGGLVDWIQDQKLFDEIGRVTIFVTEHDNVVVEHCADDANGLQYQETVWLRTRLDRTLYIVDRETGERHYVEGHGAVFNDADYYGGDPHPKMTFHVRVDGAFTRDVRDFVGVVVEGTEH